MRQYPIQHLSDLRRTNGQSAWAGITASTDSSGLPASSDWTALPLAAIDQYLEGPNTYRPKAEARLARDDQALYVRLQVAEKDPLITWQRHQDPVYKDSCLEFFVQPNPGLSSRYLNFEFNAAGVVLSAFGEGRHDRIPLTAADLDALVIEPRLAAGTQTSDQPPFWQIVCRIPRTLLEQTCGPIDWQAGHVMMGNFYKCGDQTAEPHYGCWNLVKKLDFHRPEDFGRLVFA